MITMSNEDANIAGRGCRQFCVLRGKAEVALDEKSLMKYYESMKAVNESLFGLSAYEGG